MCGVCVWCVVCVCVCVCVLLVSLLFVVTVHASPHPSVHEWQRMGLHMTSASLYSLPQQSSI